MAVQEIETVDPIVQARANRTHALAAWLGGSDMKDPNDTRFPRWPGDDGRSINMSDFQFWSQDKKDAEAAEFARLDTIYETDKAALK